eukprot:103426-Chlamydomonas_euryale.AAC.1
MPLLMVAAMSDPADAPADKCGLVVACYVWPGTTGRNHLRISVDWLWRVMCGLVRLGGIICGGKPANM